MSLHKNISKYQIILFIIQILIILTAILFIIYYDKINSKESFQDTPNTNEVLIDESSTGETKESKLREFLNLSKGEKLNDKLYPITIFEESLIKHNILNKYPNLFCEIIPYLECNTSYPVHIIDMPNEQYLAVFNDGKLYQTDNLKTNLWNGPLKNSLINTTIPLRMITLDETTKHLIGVGYDNKVYIKKNILNDFENIDETIEWTEYSKLGDNNKNIIYILFYYNSKLESENKLQHVIIDIDGNIKIENNSNNSFRVVNVLNNSVERKFLKLFMGNDGYMLALDNNFRLGSFDNKEWLTSSYSELREINKHHYILDIIYDNDAMFMGLIFNFTNEDIELMKQENNDFNYNSKIYQNKFYSLNNSLDKNNNSINIVLIDKIKLKLGTSEYINITNNSDNNFFYDNNYNYAIQKQQLLDMQEIRKLCKDDLNTFEQNYINIELNKKLQSNAELIENATNELNNFLNSNNI